MTPDQTELLRQTRDASIRTEERVNALIKTQEGHSHRLAHLERWHWTLHGIWAALTSGAVLFRDKLLALFV